MFVFFLWGYKKKTKIKLSDGKKCPSLNSNEALGAGIAGIFFLFFVFFFLLLIQITLCSLEFILREWYTNNHIPFLSEIIWTVIYIFDFFYLFLFFKTNSKFLLTNFLFNFILFKLCFSTCVCVTFTHYIIIIIIKP